KKLQGKYLRIISPVSPVKLYCSCIMNVVLTVAVIALYVTLSVRKEKLANVSPGPCYATCPRDWIGFGSKCFYFSEDTRNWTSSQSSCIAREAHLALFESLEELSFLKRYKGDSDHWIGLHRESPQHPWRWTDNTEYNSLVLIRGRREHAYLTDTGISSSRDYTYRKWICSNHKAILCKGQ
ncbi:C-type lectin domain family 2 member H-like isoform X1, partial [Cricetulus griseus]